MDIFDGPYYSVSKWFLEFVGLWPFQSTFKRRMGFAAFVFINATVVLPQIILLVLQKGSNFNILIENSLSILFTTACLLKYTVTYFAKPEMELLLLQIAKDWRRTTVKTEIEILSKSGEEARILVLFYTGYIFAAWVVYNVLPFIPPLLDIFLPLENGTLYSRVYPFHADYIFFKQADYHYESCLHVFLVYFVTTSLFAAADTIYVATVKHSCGLFNITCHRLETVGHSAKNTDLNFGIRSDVIVHRDMIKAIMMHCDTIRCVELLENSYCICFMLVQFMVVIGIATLLFYMMFIYDQTFNICRFGSFFMGLILHLLYLNWVGQMIIDSSKKIFYSVYYSDWYLASTRARKLTNIVMIRSLYHSQLTAGKISVLSMETFGALMKTSMSYCTVLLSLA